MAWFDKVRLYLIYTIAVALIILAVVFSVLRAVLPHATGYVDDLEQVLTEQIGLPVSIGSMDADMYWLVPRLKLVDVVIHDKNQQRELLRLDEAIFALAFIDSILQLSPTVGDISLVGADLYIERFTDNRWRIQGVEFGGDTSTETETNVVSQELISAVRNTDFSLLDSDIHWHDHSLKTGQLDFFGANIVIEEFLGDHSLEVNLKLPEAYGKTLRLIVKTEGDIAHLSEAELDIYLQGDAIDIGQWHSVLGINDFPSIKGLFSGELWLLWKDNGLEQITLNASMQQLQLKQENRDGFSLDNLTARLAWEKFENGWSFRSRDIYLIKQGITWQEPASIAIVQDASGLSASVSYVRLQDLIEFSYAFLTDEQLEGFNTYPLKSLAGDFYNTKFVLPTADTKKIKLSTDFEDFDFLVPDNEISFGGVDGSLEYADEKVRVELLSEMVEIDFGDLFRQPVNVDLAEGVVFAEHDSNNWRITSDNFYLLNPDVEVNTRLELLLNDDGAIYIDIQSDYKNLIGAEVGKYYPVSIMTADLINWLDMAITDGFVESGSFIMHGNVSHFPYLENDGVLQTVFDTSDLTMKFLDGWPSVENLSGHVRFHNFSLCINEVEGSTYSGQLTNANLLVSDLDNPYLIIDGFVKAPAEEFQQYVWDSGLDEILGSAMKQFQASGEVSLDLNLEVPLADDSDILAKGKLQFDGNELYLPVMNYLLTEVSGDLFFEGDDLKANGIKALFETSPVSINVLNIETSEESFVDDELVNQDPIFDDGGNYSESIINIKGNLPIDGLLNKFDWIPQSWVEGASDWNVSVHLPKDSEEYSVYIEMESELEGVEVNLTDAVSKKPDQLLPIKMEVKALDNALQVDVRSEEEFTLFATRNDEDVWDFVVDSSLVRGSGEFVEDLNKESTASLDLEYIDLLTLFKSSKKGGGSIALKPTFFPSLNFNAKTLLWNDWTFNNAKLDTSWHSHGMLINSVSLEGPSLKINGRGSWLSSWQYAHKSNFKFFVKSDDFGNTLSSLNLSDSMKRCQHSATVDWQWFDAPYHFSWDKLQGSSKFKMKDGQVKTLDPGAGGRLVGLFNVFKLADRLTLDFKDVAGEGFVFDSIEGDFEFLNGRASTNNVEVNAAAADMKLKGNIGMVDRDYDLSMQVKPHSSAAMFTGGTLAGGPVVGAGLVLINKLLGLASNAYDEYAITGSWEDPKVKQVKQRIVEVEGDDI